MMGELVYAQALLMAGEPAQKERELLRVLCGAAASSLALRLKEGLTPESCGQDFVAAASLYALAALVRTREDAGAEEFRAGDLTVKTGGADREGAARSLQQQAELLMRPYLADSFAFLGV